MYANVSVALGIYIYVIAIICKYVNLTVLLMSKPISSVELSKDKKATGKPTITNG